MKIDTSPKYDFSDVFIKPRYSEIFSRKLVDISQKVWGKKVAVPMVSANMDTVTDGQFAAAVTKAGGLAAIHRYMTVEENVKEFEIFSSQTPGKMCFCSLGTNVETELERFHKLYEAGARWFIIDIAHGASINTMRMLEQIQGHYVNNGLQKDVKIVVGNVATRESLEPFFEEELAGFVDGFKVGIGPGCFAAGTRILMADASYKNIEDVKPGDFVINKHGKPVKVKRSFSTGKRDVVSYRTSLGIGETVCTPDHRHWIGDISTNNCISSTGYKKVLDKKTKSGNSKYKWKEVQELNKENSVFLLPKTIEFILPETFSIELINQRNRSRSITLKPSYGVGYVFGTYLGDGSTRRVTDEKGRSNAVQWSFEKFQQNEVSKLVSSLEEMGLRAVSTPKKNMIVVTLYSKPFADFLSGFGKRTNKHLPSSLLVDDKEYQRGLLDGLIDSDGTHSSNRIGFHNTSKQLIELFGVLSYLINGSFPNVEKPVRNEGKLVGLNKENLNECYCSRQLTNPKHRQTEKFQISKLLQSISPVGFAEVFDLEVEDESHSFIANNAIVHNSVCTTKNVTGVTVPQFSAIVECVQRIRNYDEFTGHHRLIIADGGIREIGDIAKAIGAGADLVMSGKLFAECEESIASRHAHTGNKIVYRGMASKNAMLDFHGKMSSTPEGREEELECKKSVKEMLHDVEGGLRSAFSYNNSRTLQQFRGNVHFGVRYK